MKRPIVEQLTGATRRALGLLMTAVLGVAGIAAATGIGAAARGGTMSGSAVGLVGQWHLDKVKAVNDVPITPDSSGNGLDGRVSGPSLVPGRFGNAFEFAGGNVDVRNPGALLAPSSVTVLAWVKRSGSPGQYKYVVAKGARGPCVAASYALYTGPSGGLFFYIDDGSQARLSPDAGQGVWDGNWHMVAGSFDGSTIRLYVDGAQVGSGTPAAASINYAAAAASNESDLVFGQYPNESSCPGFEWKGDLDEVRVYSLALTDSELHYLGTANGSTPPDLPPPTTTTTSPTTTTTTTTPTPTTTRAAPPTNTALPHIAGASRAGQAVTCNPGSWTGNPTFSYAWIFGLRTRVSPFKLKPGRRSFGVKSGPYFSHATAHTLWRFARVGTTRTITIPDLPTTQSTFGCLVTAHAAKQTATGSSQVLLVQTELPVLARGRNGKFSPPRITPKVGAGGTNICTPGNWAHYPTFAFAWYWRGAKSKIRPRGALRLLHRGQSFSLVPANEGEDVVCIVTATNRAGSSTAGSNDYVVPANAPQPTQQPFVDVSTSHPTSSPGLIGPEGGDVIAEQIHLTCLNGRWNRTDLTFQFQWVDPAPSYGEHLDYDMRPGRLQYDLTVYCVVTATTSHGVSSVSVSGPIHIWSGCRMVDSNDYSHGGDQAVHLLFEPFEVFVAEPLDVATAGYVDLISPSPQDSTLYTYGPNCLDYQRYFENEGYTVKQKDG